MTKAQIGVKLATGEDAEALLALEVRNREFFQGFAGKRQASSYTLAGQQNRVEKAVDEAEKDEGYLFLIRLQETKEVIGEVALTEVQRGPLQSCWIGYFLDQAHNGKGYMTEAVRQVVEVAFQTLQFHRIEAGVMPHNLASMKVLLKAGFHKEGIARQNVCINGEWKDHQTLAIINEPKELRDEAKKPMVESNFKLIPADTLVFLLSGQAGTDANGEVPEGVEAQLVNALMNSKEILTSENASMNHILKVNIWATERLDKAVFQRHWQSFYEDSPPAMTLGYVSELADSATKVEIEVWAAR
ncbi:GNAT family N-acetyltransferase [Bacillaceae bacterium SIJ1]|uniref:GNAT family N-acetyltransferase n=1 Tax=Litoribacterium kuwaitense TaxID=1398745 RepID=UPI0013ED2AA4|nr:GNAT family N-acetyltransferase [Litoribacterium kuwaitense]NGP45574.1 GNAT family N-acetyltransferase [Litoribacterium kuwaitense]